MMATPVQNLYLYLSLIIFVHSVHHSNQLQSSQSQSLQSILQFLDYPSVLNSFADSSDLCSVEPNSYLTLACYENNLTQLHIIGSNGTPPFPVNFSSDLFFDAVASLSSLKVLSLVSLGLSGPLPQTIGRLDSLEILNFSSNYFTGSIPMQLSSLRNLQTLALDQNKFTGQLPNWLCSFPVLAVLSLKNNLFNGSLPPSLSSMQNLRILSLSMNFFDGEVPDLSNLTNLQVLDLEGNHFGPHFPRLHNKLVTLVLRNNSFGFGVPAELDSYYQLHKLDISFNGFVGPILPSLLSLPSIACLDVSHNKLTGMLFGNLSCNPGLAYADFSSNLLSGTLPTCLNLSSKNRFVLYFGNCLSNGDQKQHPSDFCHNQAIAVEISPHGEEKHKSPHGKAVLASSTIGGTLGGIAIVSMIFLVIRKVYNNSAEPKSTSRVITENVSALNTVKLLSDARHISETMKLGASIPAYRTFALEELKEATSDFHASNLLFEDSNYQLYRGKLADGAFVAIRILTVRTKQSPHILRHYIEFISKLRHHHLASTLGHCLDLCLDDSRISRIFLLFEFFSNGTLRDHTSGLSAKKLSWVQRIGAAIGVARGIQFLHTGIVPGVFFNSLKITDILLDHDLQVKISCHNQRKLAEIGGLGGGVVSNQGTKQKFRPRPLRWFIRETRLRSHSEEKDEDREDIYDLGVILLEIIAGRPITSHNDAIILKDLLRVSVTVDDTARKSLVDPAVQKGCSDESLKTMMEICLRCLSEEPKDRPSVEDVLWNLQFAAQVQDSWKGTLQNNHDSLTSSTHYPIPLD